MLSVASATATDDALTWEEVRSYNWQDPATQKELGVGSACSSYWYNTKGANGVASFSRTNDLKHVEKMFKAGKILPSSVAVKECHKFLEWYDQRAVKTATVKAALCTLSEAATQQTAAPIHPTSSAARTSVADAA